jgi:predicted small metal-binding protein
MLQTREVRCADVHPVRCNVALRGSTNESVTDRVCAHGAMVHGFTPVWYSPARIAAIAAACTRSIPQ